MNEATFQKVIAQKAALYGDSRVIVCARTGKTLTYRQLKEQTEAMARALTAQGLSAGNAVILMMENSVEFAVSFFGVTQFGGVAVPVNTGLKTAELDYLISDSQAAAVLLFGTLSEQIPSKYRKNIVALANGCTLLKISDGTPKDAGCAPRPESTGNGGLRSDDPGYIQQPENTGSELSSDDPGYVQQPENTGSELRPADPGYVQQPDDVAMMLYTSGTTGHPKGVILSYQNLLSKAEHIREAHQLTRDDVVLCVLPWFHINGLVITLITPLVSDGRIIIGGKFSVTNFWSDVEKYRATWFSGVPTMYSHLLARGIPRDRDWSSLRFARSASSPLPVAVLEEFEGICHVPIIESYGITEGASQITTNPMQPLPRKPGSVGLPYGNQIKIVDSEGNELPAGRTGEVLIRGENITRGYFRKEEETRKAFTGEWFHSGDLGYLDEDGYLYLDGRIKELINRAGEKFSPREVDEVIYRMDEVELAATVGVPDEVYGEEVAAFIKVREGASLKPEQVKDWCAMHLAAYKVPRMVFFIDDLPKGGNGKIQRLKLIDIFREMKKGGN